MGAQNKVSCRWQHPKTQGKGSPQKFIPNNKVYINFNETFSPFASFETVKPLLALPANLN